VFGMPVVCLRLRFTKTPILGMYIHIYVCVYIICIYTYAHQMNSYDTYTAVHMILIQRDT
jgi:hypothetical protein